MKKIALLVVGVCSGLVVTSAMAQSGDAFPRKPVRLIIPFATSGSNDIVGRVVGQKLGEKWKQQVIPDNRPGANGIIGTEVAARADPDGHTLLITSTSFVMNPVVTKVAFDPIADFVPISLVAEGALLLASHPSFTSRTARDMIALAKAKPGTLQYATSGNGGITHLAGELLQKMAGIKLVQVPYKGSSASAIDVVSGQVPLIISSMSPVLPYVQSGRLRPLAVCSLNRSVILPDVPTLAEQGVPGYDSTMWWGIMAPARTPAAIVKAINADINQVVESADVKSRIAALGMSAVGATPDAFTAVVGRDYAKWGKIIKDIGLKDLAP